MTNTGVRLLSILCLLVFAACGGDSERAGLTSEATSTADAQLRVLRGTVDAHPYVLGDDHTCTTDSLSIGTAVTVRDVAGRTIGTDTINRSETTADEIITRVFRCRFSFAVEVPAVSSYQVNVGAEPPATFSSAEVESAGWIVKLFSGNCQPDLSCNGGD